MTTLQTYNDFRKSLKNIYDDAEAQQITDWIFENVTGLKKVKWRTLSPESLLPANQSKVLKDYLKLLKQHTPVQYVLNEAWFFKRKFFVNEQVLIPRPETEELVEWIIEEVKQNQFSGPISILDIGTGSGCIPVSLKKELPRSQVTAIDVSEEAIEVAKENARLHQAEIAFQKINFLNEQVWYGLPKFDILVSNPPYIPISGKETLNKNVVDFEPNIALFVKDDNPFIFYFKISSFAKEHLEVSGKIFVEVNEEYADEVKAIFEKDGFSTQIKKDIYGKERMINARFI